MASGLVEIEEQGNEVASSSAISHSIELAVAAGQSLLEEEEVGIELGKKIASSSATLPSVGSISREDHQTLHAQEFEINLVPAPEILDDDTSSTASPAHHVLNITEQQYGTEIQLLRRKNIAQIVKNRNLQELSNIGDVKVIAKALNSDLNYGIISGSQGSIGQKIPSKFAASLFPSFLGVCKNYTILYLLCFAVLSLIFGIKQRGFNMMGCRDGAVVLLVIFVLVIAGTTYNFIWEKWSQKKLDDIGSVGM